MKKYLTFLFAALLLTSVSCQKEFAAGEGDRVDVTFNIPLEGVVGTKAVGDAGQDKELLFYAYRIVKNGDGTVEKRTFLDNITIADESTDYEGEAADGFGFDLGTGTEATVIAKLVKGQTYGFVFWAQTKDKSYYTISPDDDENDDVDNPFLKVNYENLSAQDDARDAFFAVVELDVTKSMGDQLVTLRRPFAQINVATTRQDYEDALGAGVDINATSVTLSGVADKLDFFSQKAEATAADGNEVEVSFAAASTLSENFRLGDETSTVDEEELAYPVYLSMNYVLPICNIKESADKTNDETYTPSILKGFTISLYQRTGEGQDVTDELINTIDVENVPVRPNWKTNIVGEDILTEDGTFNVSIEPGFYGENIISLQPRSPKE